MVHLPSFKMLLTHSLIHIRITTSKPIRIIIMLMSRKDVRINNRKVNCKNSTGLGFSSATLKRGDFFNYRDDGTDQVRLAKMHHQIEHDPLCNCTGWIVAQVASPCMTFTMERWVNPIYVLQVIPDERMPAPIREHFIEREMQQPAY